MGHLPTATWKVTPHGAFDYERRSEADGSCGTSDYPCKHPGVDLAGNPGDAVYAPEDGTLVAVAAVEPGEDLPRPWRGYGPGIVVMKGKSGRWHVLAHLEDDDLRQRWAPFLTSGLDPAKPIADQVNNVQLVIKRDGSKSVPVIHEGDIVGVIGGARHVHWEVRKSLFGGRYNPAIWADTFVWHHNAPAGVDLEATLKPEDGLVVVVLAMLAGAFILRSKR